MKLLLINFVMQKKDKYKRKMKTLVPLILTVLIALTAFGCQTRNQHGLPENVCFPASGGYVTLHDDGYLGEFEIKDEDRHFRVQDTAHCGTLEVEYKWLRVTANISNRTLTLEAQPLEDSIKKRTITILFYGAAYTYGNINIKQQR